MNRHEGKENQEFEFLMYASERAIKLKHNFLEGQAYKVKPSAEQNLKSSFSNQYNTFKNN